MSDSIESHRQRFPLRVAVGFLYPSPEDLAIINEETGVPPELVAVAEVEAKQEVFFERLRSKDRYGVAAMDARKKALIEMFSANGGLATGKEIKACLDSIGQGRSHGFLSCGVEAGRKCGLKFYPVARAKKQIVYFLGTEMSKALLEHLRRLDPLPDSPGQYKNIGLGCGECGKVVSEDYRNPEVIPHVCEPCPSPLK